MVETANGDVYAAALQRRNKRTDRRRPKTARFDQFVRRPVRL